jgi:ubiquinone/menaquinone biosynthesis C-methylase UbiE
MESSSQQIRDNVRRAYDDIAERYLAWAHSPHNNIRLSYLELVLAPLRDDAAEKHVLELGCGAGVPCTQALASQGNIRVTANDISSAQIALARERLPASSSVTLLEADMMDLAFADRQFDAVIAMYSIIHLPRDDQITMVRRIARWLKPGGWFLANFAATAAESITDAHWLGGKEGTMYWSAWDADKTCSILVDAGFEITTRDINQETEDDGNGARVIPFLWTVARK